MTIRKGLTWIVTTNGNASGRPIPTCIRVHVASVGAATVTYYPTHPRTGAPLMRSPVVVGREVFALSISDAPVTFPADTSAHVYWVGRDLHSLVTITGATPDHARRNAETFARSIAKCTGSAQLRDIDGHHIARFTA